MVIFLSKRIDITEELKNQIIDLYQKGISFTQIQNITGINRKKVSDFLVKEGIYTKKISTGGSSKYHKDESVFEIIDTEHKAYWLGFLYADGYVDTIYGKTRIALKQEDINHLKKFKRFMSSDAPIVQRIENWAFQIDIHSMKIAEDLTKLGCFQCKSLTLKFPTTEQVPEHLIHHFLRGYFDGDGAITAIQPSINNRSYYLQPSINIVGTPEFLDGFEYYILKAIGRTEPNKRITKKEWNNQTQAFTYSGTLLVPKIFDFLYKDATIFLTRKLLRFNQFGMYLPPQEEAIRTLERITAELSEEPVKLNDLESLSRQFESEGVQYELIDSDINDSGDTNQAQRVDSDPFTSVKRV